jgi:hypothetical protein
MRVTIFSFIFLLISSFAYAQSTCLYYENDGETFENSAQLTSAWTQAKVERIQDTEHKFLGQVKSADEFLYIATHGWKNGVMIGDGSRVAWDKVRKHIKANIVIFDTCHSVSGLEISKQDTIIVAATGGPGFAFNLKLIPSSDERWSVLSVALASYFLQVDPFQEISLPLYNETNIHIQSVLNKKSTEEIMLQDIQKSYMKLLFYGVQKEGIDSVVNSFFKQQYSTPAIWLPSWKIQ